MERKKIIEKAIPRIQAHEIMQAMNELDDVIFENGFADQLTANFNGAVLFCAGVACGIAEERQRIKNLSQTVPVCVPE